MSEQRACVCVLPHRNVCVSFMLPLRTYSQTRIHKRRTRVRNRSGGGKELANTQTINSIIIVAHEHEQREKNTMSGRICIRRMGNNCTELGHDPHDVRPHLSEGVRAELLSCCTLHYRYTHCTVWRAHSPIRMASPNSSVSSIPCLAKYRHVWAYTSRTRLFASTRK